MGKKHGFSWSWKRALGVQTLTPGYCKDYRFSNNETWQLAQDWCDDNWHDFW